MLWEPIAYTAAVVAVIAVVAAGVIAREYYRLRQVYDASVRARRHGRLT